MSRRPQMYKQFVDQIENLSGTLIDSYFVFVNDPQTLPFYKSLEISNPKVKVFNAPEDFVYRYGHDTVYNYLEKQVQSPYVLKLFDTDTVEIDPKLLEEELKKGADIYGMETYMERGNVWETKFQLYKKGVLEWFGLVHENQHFKGNVNAEKMESIKVYHHNALDPESANLKKNAEGFIILEKTKEGSDSDLRNLLYETLTWKIVNENGRHDNPAWFHRHYEFNKEVVNWYYSRAKKRFKL